MDKFHQLPKVIQDTHKIIEWFIPQVEKLPRSRQWQRTPLLGFLFLLLWSLNAPTYAAGNVPVTLPAKPCVNTLNTLPEMQLIPAGVFQMGSPDSEVGRYDDESPLHTVSVYRPFALSRCEVTVGQFKRFIAETKYVTDAEKGDGCFVLNNDKSDLEQVKGTSWKDPRFAQTDDHPVVCVSWQDARAYTRWLSAITGAPYRLPSEAEWEYAARTQDGAPFSRYWGNDAAQACQYANGRDQTLKAALPDWQFTVNSCEDGAVYTQRAGVYRANAFGLSDMLGNAWEWVEDCYNDNYQGAPDDGSAWETTDCSRRVLRGGGWNNKPEILRSAYRFGYYPDAANYSTGFRIARAL